MQVCDAGKNGLESIITSSKDRCLCVCVFVLVKPPASACESEAKTGQKGGCVGCWAGSENEESPRRDR